MAQLGYPKGHLHLRMPNGIGWFLRQLCHGSAPLYPTLPPSLRTGRVPRALQCTPTTCPTWDGNVRHLKGFQCWRPTMLHLYTCVHAQSLQSSPTLCNPVDCSPPGSSIHGILQARILEPSSRGIFPTQESNLHLSSTDRQVLYH